MTQVSIHVQRKAYPAGSAAILEDVHLELAAGEFVCLVGPSGCGKTTLLNLVAGLDHDCQGHIAIGHRQGREPAIGYVFQNPRLLPWRTVRENIDLALPAGARADVDGLLRILGLEQAQDVYPQRLSLGMSRRVAIARAFAIEPDLLLMDEPFVSLDPPTARRVRQLLLAVWKTRRPHTVLFVTHDLREAIALADRLVFLGARPGHVVAQVGVDIPRAERDEDRVEAFRLRLAAEWPEIASLL